MSFNKDLHLYKVGFNSRDPGSILGLDISRDILKNPGISRFDFYLQLLIYFCTTVLYCKVVNELRFVYM